MRQIKALYPVISKEQSKVVMIQKALSPDLLASMTREDCLTHLYDIQI